MYTGVTEDGATEEDALVELCTSAVTVSVTEPSEPAVIDSVLVEVADSRVCGEETVVVESVARLA
jgi:hypothetical protein